MVDTVGIILASKPLLGTTCQPVLKALVTKLLTSAADRAPEVRVAVAEMAPCLNKVKSQLGLFYLPNSLAFLIVIFPWRI